MPRSSPDVVRPVTTPPAPRGPASTIGATGMYTVNVEPRPGALSTSTRPPCASAMCLTSARPMPLPRTLRARAFVGAVEALEDPPLLVLRRCRGRGRATDSATRPGRAPQAATRHLAAVARVLDGVVDAGSAAPASSRSRPCGRAAGRPRSRCAASASRSRGGGGTRRARARRPRPDVPRRSRSSPCRARGARSRARCRSGATGAPPRA